MQDYGLSREALVDVYLSGMREEAKIHPDDPFVHQGLSRLISAKSSASNDPADLDEAVRKGRGSKIVSL